MAPLTTRKPHSRRAMTLLELLLAVTLLAAMSSLIAALWSQASAWSEGNAEHHRAQRLARVLEMMRAQWGDRRTSAKLDGKGATVGTDRDALTFVTATSILEPGWPLVRARYIVQRDYDTGVGRLSAWKLVYEETPIADLKKSQGIPREGEPPPLISDRPPEAPPVRRHILLANCPRLVWERFGRAASVEQAERAAPTDDAASPTSDSDQSPVPIASRVSATESDRSYQWRELEAEPQPQSPPAVRLAGIHQEQEFACVFVIGDSR